MVEHELGGTICRTAKFRTPTTTIIIIFKLVTQPNKAEFVFMDSKLAETAPAQVARRQMVIAFRKLVQADSRREAQRCHHQPESLTAVLFHFSSTDVAESEFSYSASSNSRECRHHTHLYPRRRTFFSCAHHSAQFTSLF